MENYNIYLNFIRSRIRSLVTLTISSIVISSAAMFYFEKNEYSLTLNSPIGDQNNQLNNYNFIVKTKITIMTKETEGDLVTGYFDSLSDEQKLNIEKNWEERFVFDQIVDGFGSKAAIKSKIIENSIIDPDLAFQELYYVLKTILSKEEKYINFKVSRLRVDGSFDVGSNFFNIIYSSYANRGLSLSKDQVSKEIETLISDANIILKNRFFNNVLVSTPILTENNLATVSQTENYYALISQMLDKVEFHSNVKKIQKQSSYIYFISTFIFSFLIIFSLGIIILIILSLIK